MPRPASSLTDMDTQIQYDKADRLFDLSLEVEGLLALIRRREDFTAPEVFTLLLDKVAELAEGVRDLCPDSAPATPQCADNPQSGESPMSREQRFIASMPSLPGLWDEPADEVAPTESASEGLIHNEQLPAAEPAPDAEADEEHQVSSDELEAAADERPVPVEEKQMIAQAVLFETEEDADEAPGIAAEERTGYDSPPSRRQPGDLRRSFTINDKFRFRRELFGNSDSEFTDALNLVEAMNSPEEAEDYFYNDLGWDREQPEVVEFMTVIANYFE